MSEPVPSDFTTVEDVLGVVQNMEDSGRDRAADRATIDNQFNGGRPYTPEEVEKHQIQVNANFLEGYKIAQDGILQVNSALLFKDQYFTTKCLRGKVEKREQWGQKFAANANRALKRGRTGHKNLFVMKNRNASLVLHGIGALLWANNFDLLPRFVALNDLLIPTDTPLDLTEELSQFGVNVWLTPYQLRKMTKAEKTDKAWDTGFADEIIKSLKQVNNYTPDIWQNPEEAESLWKQKALYMNSDAVPKIKLTYFYYQNPDTGKWHRKIVVRENQAAINTPILNKFLYDGKDTVFADNINQILHVQYGDGSVVAPIMFHSERGLGVLLYSVIELMNRLRCQWTQHVFESLMTILRITSPSQQDRPKILQLHPYAVLEDGVNFVPPEQRHQVDPRLPQSAMAEYRQLMAESSTGYLQDIDTGTQKEQTLGEAQIKLQSANKMVAGMLESGYSQETFLYEEELRRLLNKTSQDPVVKTFREKCIADGIPEALLTPDNWEVHVTRVFGGGDATLAKQESQWLLSNSQRYDPSAQRIILRRATSTVMADPDLANELVPETPDEATSGRLAAEGAFGTLMQGIPVTFRQGITQTDYVETMLTMMATVIDRISQTDNMGTPQEIQGLKIVEQDIQEHLDFLEQDEQQQQFVKQASDALGKLSNFIKGFEQRQQEAMQQMQNGNSPETLQKVADMRLLADTKAEISRMSADTKARNNQIKFELDSLRKNLEWSEQLSQEERLHKQEMAHKQLDKMQELVNSNGEAPNQN